MTDERKSLLRCESLNAGPRAQALNQAKRGEDAFRPHDRFEGRPQKDPEVFGETEEVCL